MVNRSSMRAFLDEYGELPDDVLLGKIAIFSIHDGRTPFSDVEKLFEDLDLNKAMMPLKNKAVDAFRKATSDLDRTTYLFGNGLHATLMCRDVATTDNYVQRQITREIKDSKHRVISYDAAINCTFYRAPRSGAGDPKGRERVKVTWNPENLQQPEHEVIEEYSGQIQREYLNYFAHLDGNKIRATVRKYFKHLNAIELKGSTYFVHQNRSDELNRLAQFVDRLGGGCKVDLIPMVDVGRQREILADAFEREASQQLREITKEAKMLLETRKTITASMFQKMKKRFDDLLENANEHMAALEVSQDVTAASAEVALAAIHALREEMME